MQERGILALTAVAAAATTGYLLFRTHRALTSSKHKLPNKFSQVFAPNTDKEEDYGAHIRVHPKGVCTPEELAERVIPNFRGVMTMWDIFENAALNVFPREPLHGRLNSDLSGYEFETYEEVYSDIMCLAQALEDLGLFGDVEPHCGLRLFGLFGPNSSEWARLEYAAMSQSVTLVTLYTTLNQDGVNHVLNFTNVCTVAALNEACALRCLEAKSLGLKNLVVMQKTSALEERANARQVKLYTLQDLREHGKAMKHLHALRPPKPDTIWTFCFTSGSTGLPKGALLTHRALVSNISSTIDMLHAHLIPGQEVYLSFLPLAHQMERTMFGMMTSLGGRIGFSRGDPLKIMEDVKLLRPTFFASVPRLLNRLAKAIEHKVSLAPPLAQRLFHLALECKLADLTAYAHFTHPIWDRLVFNKIRRELGLDRCRIMVTGSAPIAPRTLDFLRCVLCVPVNEGYGQTEATCAITMATPLHAGGSATRPSHVGGPIRCVEIKLRSVPEMHYLVSDREHDGQRVYGRGEVLVRGSLVMTGYYCNAEKTRQAVDEEGWLHTGDIGTWFEDGTLGIVDRANSIFKTSIGEYIQPDKIERAVCANALVQAAFVYGTPLNSKVVCIVVLADGVDAVADAEEIKKQLVATCRSSGLLGFEIPGAFALKREMFTIESGVLTATSKIVRSAAKDFFQADIVQLFKELGEEVKV